MSASQPQWMDKILDNLQLPYPPSFFPIHWTRQNGSGQLTWGSQTFTLPLSQDETEEEALEQWMSQNRQSLLEEFAEYVANFLEEKLGDALLEKVCEALYRQGLEEEEVLADLHLSVEWTFDEREMPQFFWQLTHLSEPDLEPVEVFFSTLAESADELDLYDEEVELLAQEFYRLWQEFQEDR